MNRVRNFKLVLWMIIGVGAAVATARFMFGLGSTTNLTDNTPWGIWIGFDVMSGVALAAGGFVLTATVYIFKLEKFHSIVRPAVLTAFLGYIAVAFGLLFDLGLPWNIWHMMVFWNPHSPLFEVGWCVMLYLTVLLLEFFPVPAEEFGFLSNIRNILIKLRLPLVIAGIALSTLHQSSLGSLFLIMPYNVHPLWYSPILPVIFFISAIGLGLMMVTFESLFTAWLYRRKPETYLLEKIGAASRWVFMTYLIIRVGDLIIRGQLGHLNSGEWQVKMFWFELLIVAIIPTVLLSFKSIRTKPSGLMTVAITAVTGIVLNRINVGGLVHINRGDTVYLPAWTEIAITAAVISVAAVVFLYMVERFNIWELRPVDPDANPTKMPEFHPVDGSWLGVPGIAARTKYSLGFIIAAAIGFAFLSGEPVESRGVDPTPVHNPRGGDTLWIDGNLDGYGTAFNHKEHEKRNGNEKSCSKCHHMNQPRDKHTGCSNCHKDMYLSTDAFGHDWHSSPSGGKLKCNECHDKTIVRNADSAKKCDYCHQGLVPPDSDIEINTYKAISYTEAMHLMCINCHTKVAVEKEKPALARCENCHAERRNLVDSIVLDTRREKLTGKRMVLPPIYRKLSDE